MFNPKLLAFAAVSILCVSCNEQPKPVESTGPAGTTTIHTPNQGGKRTFSSPTPPVTQYTPAPLSGGKIIHQPVNPNAHKDPLIDPVVPNMVTPSGTPRHKSRQIDGDCSATHPDYDAYGNCIKWVSPGNRG